MHLCLVLIMLLCTIVSQQLQDQVLLNYQIISYDGENITIGVLYSGSCTILRAEVFSRTDIINSDFGSPANHFSTAGSDGAEIVIPRQALSQIDDMFIHLIALNNSLVCSDDSSPDNFYYFSPNGKCSKSTKLASYLYTAPPPPPPPS